MATIEVKTARGNIARISVDMSRHKGKSKDAFIAAEKGIWIRAYSGVSEERVKEALGKLWDASFPEKAEIKAKPETKD